MMNIERWLRLMQAWGFAPSHETFESLLAAYSEKERHYHTVEHVSACLRHFDRCRVDVEYPREVEIALWFHDAIYKPLSSNNEKESADWAASFLAERGATDAEVGSWNVQSFTPPDALRRRWSNRRGRIYPMQFQNSSDARNRPLVPTRIGIVLFGVEGWGR